MRFALLFGCLAVACSEADSPTSSSSGSGGGGATHGTWHSLVSADWSVPPGSELYYCARVTVDEPMLIAAFRPEAPVGTHHTALAIDGSDGPDGSFPCSSATVGAQILFGSGIGTPAYALPEGVAYRVDAGQKLLLNLHLFNTGAGELRGTSGVEVLRVDPSDVVHEAETIYTGAYDLDIPPGAEVTQTGRCTMTGEATIFGLFPHMHKLGRRIRGAIEGAAGEVELIDRPYSFEEQLNYALAPARSVKAGDVVRVECTYENTGTRTVTFGESSEDEMCFLGLYRYPRLGGGSTCSD
jgi:hypothetical protein